MGAGATALLGPGLPVALLGEMVLEDTAPHCVDLSHLEAGDIILGVEGLEFAGEVKLRMEVLDDVGAPTGCADEIQLKVAPLILLDHLQPVVKSYVSQVTGTPAETAHSAEYCTVRFPDATPPPISDEIIPPALNDTYDRWAQDEFQIGFQEAPYKSMYVVLDSKRDGGLEPFPPTLLGPDFGHMQIDDGVTDANSLDSFGNLEVSPPCIVGGTDYPFGRIYYGYADSLPDERKMDEALRNFLARQQVQAPVILNSDWLAVGHVDEFMSIVPNPNATQGWTVLFADPVLALDILAGDELVQGGVGQNLHIPRYTDHSVVQLGALLGRATEEGATTIEMYNALGGPLDVVLQPLRETIEQEFDLVISEDLYRIPVLFDLVYTDSGNKALAITPDVVNGAVYGSTFIAPDPFLHALIEEDANSNWRLDSGEDTNGNYMLDTTRDPFKVWVNQNVPANIDVEYIDDWVNYHLWDGEVHCGSNEVRSIPPDPKWWWQVP